jgi:hypothetical protein
MLQLGDRNPVACVGGGGIPEQVGPLLNDLAYIQTETKSEWTTDPTAMTMTRMARVGNRGTDQVYFEGSLICLLTNLLTPPIESAQPSPSAALLLHCLSKDRP